MPSKCLKNFICAASKRCSSLFLSTQKIIFHSKIISLERKHNNYWPSTIICGHMKVVMLSVLRTGHLHPAGYIPGIATRYGLEGPGIESR